MYFLGSYARYELADKSVYKVERDKKVIDIDKKWHRNSTLKVRYRNEAYSLAPITDEVNPTHRGSQSITMVQQLINLQKKADKVPSTATLRVVP